MATRYDTMIRLELPDDFDDHAWETEAKGWFPGAVLVVDGCRYRLTFYDPVHLAQDIEEAVGKRSTFFESNLVVVPSVTRASTEGASASLAIEAKAGLLAPEPPEQAPAWSFLD